MSLICITESLSKALRLFIQSMEFVPQYSTHKKAPSDKSYLKASLCGFLQLVARSVCKYFLQARNHSDVLTGHQGLISPISELWWIQSWFRTISLQKGETSLNGHTQLLTVECWHVLHKFFSESSLFNTAMKCLLTFWTHNPEGGYKHFGTRQWRISGYYNTAEDIRAFQLLTHIYMWLEPPPKIWKTRISSVPVWEHSNPNFLSFKRTPELWYLMKSHFFCYLSLTQWLSHGERRAQLFRKPLQYFIQ